MKFNVEVECSPEEMRRMMGLPDLTPVHDKYIASLTDAMDGVIAPRYFGWHDAELGAGGGCRDELLAEDVRECGQARFLI